MSACKNTKIFKAAFKNKKKVLSSPPRVPKNLLLFPNFLLCIFWACTQPEFSLKAPSASITSQRFSDFYSTIVIIIIILTDERHCLMFDKYQRSGLFSVVAAPAKIHTISHSCTAHPAHQTQLSFLSWSLNDVLTHMLCSMFVHLCSFCVLTMFY